MTSADRIRTMLVTDYKLDPDKLTPEALLEDLGVDSIGMAELMFNIEDAFHLSLGDEAVQLATFGEVVVYIDRLIAEHGAATGMPPAAAGRMQPAP